MGYYSRNWERFQDKILVKVDRNQVGVLDPRYPDVREYLIGIYENALQEFDLDGFKLDFIDRFKMPKLRLLMAIQGLYLKIILTLDDDPELQYNGTRRINARDCSLD